MLRKLIEVQMGPLTDPQFRCLCELLEQDIKFNKISFKKRTFLSEILNLAKICIPLTDLII